MNKKKFCKILINITLWHLRPYKVKQFVNNTHLVEYGFLCFKLVIS